MCLLSLSLTLLPLLPVVFSSSKTVSKIKHFTNGEGFFPQALKKILRQWKIKLKEANSPLDVNEKQIKFAYGLRLKNITANSINFYPSGIIG